MFTRSRLVLAPVSLLVLALAAVAPSGATGAAGQDSYEVTARTRTSWVEADAGTVRVVGQVKPWARGEQVVLLQRRSGSRRWTRTGTDRLSRTSRFVLTDRPSVPGTRYYRVLKPASDGHRADRSPALRVDVLAWERITDLQPWEGCGLQTGVTVGIGGTTYPASVEFAGYGGACIPYVVYDLGARCHTLRATYGFVDGSTIPGPYGWVAVSGDGTLRERYQVTDGGRAFVGEELDVTGVQRLRLDLGSATVAPEAPARPVAAGTPEVLCTP